MQLNPAYLRPVCQQVRGTVRGWMVAMSQEAPLGVFSQYSEDDNSTFCVCLEQYQLI